MRSMNSTKTNANLKGTTQNVMFMKYTYSPKGGKLINQRYTSPAYSARRPRRTPRWRSRPRVHRTASMATLLL